METEAKNVTPPAAAPVTVPSEPNAVPPEKKRILIVDD